MTQVTFEEFYHAFGFTNYPFQMFSSENEKHAQPGLFVRTSMYGPIIAGFLGAQSMIMAGDRGSGKTAIIYDFIREKPTPDKTLIVQIDDYSSLVGEPSTGSFYRFLIEQISDSLFTRIARNKVTIKALSYDDRISLCYFLFHFVSLSTKNELKKQIEHIQIPKFKKFWLSVYRTFRIPGNVGLNIASQFLANALSAALVVDPNNAQTKFAEYLPDLKLEADGNFFQKDSSFSRLEKLSDLVSNIELGTPICVLDKVDEDARFLNAAEDISDFVRPLLTDTKLLTSSKIQIIISVWIIPYNLLKSDVRTQKIYCPVIDWTRADLEKAAERRIRYFSDETIGFTDLFDDTVDEDDIAYLMRLSNKNPRDLWHILNYIMLAQFKADQSVNKICKAAVRQGFDDFVTGFNFFEYYPKKSNAKASSMDVYSYVKHLLKLDDVIFTRDRLNVRAGTGSSTLNYCIGMENLGLIEKAEKTGAQMNYRIRGPKVVHALKNGLDINRST